VAATAITAIVVQRGVDRRSLVLTIALTVIGLFGMLMSAKYHERFEHHINRARIVMRGFVTEPNAIALADGRRQHNMRFPILHRVRLYVLWISFHGLIALAGVALTIIALVH
jgi:hypothetical protein